MRSFEYLAPDTRASVISSVQDRAGYHYLAGGTTMLDLAKIGVMQPAGLVDVHALREEHCAILLDGDGLHLGALVTMAEAAADAGIRRHFPAIAQSLQQAASAQLRNMATLGGNVLQRTRCGYFRDTGFASCNKRAPGSGCAAIGGVNRDLAVLGVSDHCIAHYPGDFAVVLAALGAMVDLAGPSGARRILFEDLHRLPGDTPHIETSLQPGELITGFHVAAGAHTVRSLYVKIRDRQSYAFAQASACVALDLEAGLVRNVRIGLGGVAAKPWRSHEAEAALQGVRLDESSARDAAEAAFSSAVTHGGNAHKPELGRRTLVRALLAAADLKV
jgi:xanthine dehydrogenase YagS FAD-binding subunit